jgi:C1A family cysteine protease
MEPRRGLGWLPDVPKPSDYTEAHPEVAPLLARTRLAPRLAAVGAGLGVSHDVPMAPAVLPDHVDLRSWFSPIEDQGFLGSCTANAAVGLLEYFERRAFGRFVDASRLFVYKTERDLLGWTGDTGAYLRTAMEALVLFGAPPERYWPYDGRPPDTNTQYDLEPSPFCYAYGAHYEALKYFRLDPSSATPAQVLATIKQCLAAGFPSMFGFPVYSEYPAPGSSYRGGHANVAAGYDDNLTIGIDRGALLVRNSWNTTWGDAGYGWMSYRYVLEGLAVDWWSMISANWIDTGQFG